MYRFRVMLRRYYDEPKNEFSSGMFFPPNDDGIGEFSEIGETRILEITLPKITVQKIKRDYGQRSLSAAVKAFTTHQLTQVGLARSVLSWTSLYGKFVCIDVTKMPN